MAATRGRPGPRPGTLHCSAAELRNSGTHGPRGREKEVPISGYFFGDFSRPSARVQSQNALALIPMPKV